MNHRSVTGTIFSFAMIVAYKYYIKYHWYCMKSARYDRVTYSDDNVWFSPDHTCDKKCNRKYVNLELWISALELFLKDIINPSFLECASKLIFRSQSTPQKFFVGKQLCLNIDL